jgi:predicted nuclease of predicted toxin-antitoxin system
VDFVADENVPRQVIAALEGADHRVFSISRLSPRASDDAVLERSSAMGAVLITIDKDFGDLVFRQRRVAGGVLLPRLTGLTTRAKADAVLAAVREHGEALVGAFTVVAPGRIRIRHPPV